VHSLQLWCGSHLNMEGLQPTCTLPSTCTSIKLYASGVHMFNPDDIPLSDGLKSLVLSENELSASGFDRLSGGVLTHPTLTDLRLPFIIQDQLQAIQQLPPNLRTLELGCKLPRVHDSMPLSHSSHSHHSHSHPASILHSTYSTYRRPYCT